MDFRSSEAARLEEGERAYHAKGGLGAGPGGRCGNGLAGRAGPGSRGDNPMRKGPAGPRGLPKAIES